jgi:hypothetical protein
MPVTVATTEDVELRFGDSVTLACPLALSVVPESVPTEVAKLTFAPGIGLPFWSNTVAVMVDELFGSS